MADNGSRKLILRLSIEDPAAICAPSTTSTTDAAALYVDVSLRSCRQEQLRAEQQTEDQLSAWTAAQDEIRQRDAISTDGKASHRISVQLNSDGPLPELANSGQATTTESSICNNTVSKTEPPHVSGLFRFSALSVVTSPPSPLLQHTSQTPIRMETSASQLDVIDELPPKKQVVEGHIPIADSATSAQVLASTSAGRKRPVPDDDGVAPLAKRHMPSTPPRSSPVVLGETHTAAESQPASAVFRPAISLSRRPSPTSTGAPRSLQPAGLRLGPISKSHLPSRADKRYDSTTSTTKPEDLEMQKLPASRQALVAGKQPVIQQGRTSKAECVVCCKKVIDSELYSNSCGHAYCSKCINRLLANAVRDDSLWPPRCCKAEILVERIEHFLHKDLLRSVQTRQVEMSVAVPNRTYCRQCTAFIPEEQIDRTIATCHECWSLTCTECNEEFHFGGCENKLEQDMEDLEALTKKEGWKRCSTCLMIIDNCGACNHMT